MEELLPYLLSPFVLIMMVPILAVLVGGVTAVVKAWFAHKERVEKIRMGIDPDAPSSSPRD